jgi:hypothetical protein
VPDRFSKYWWMKNICPSIYNQPWNPVIRSWYLNEAAGIAHEIGHCLNLYHYCPGYYSTNACDLALMTQCGTCARNYIPPIEVGRMHAAVALTNVRTFAHEVFNPTPLKISQIVNFNIYTKLLQSIQIDSGGVLSIYCDMLMLPAAELIIKSGGKCIIDESIINSTGRRFKGIIVENGAYLELRSYSMNNHDIIVQNGGTLRISNSLIISGKNKIVIDAGGYICIENNTNINLIDGFSIIVLKNGFNSGVNTSVVVDPGTCLANPENITIMGNGSINTFTNDKYIQNETISSNRYITGNNVYVGRNVTTSKPQGNVTITNNANIIFDVAGNVFFEPGFDCTLGSTFEVLTK